MTEFSQLDVVVPAYNEGRYPQQLHAALRRAAKAAQLEVRLIIVDDGSQPGDAALLDELARNPDVTVIHRENQGRFATVLHCIKSAQTEYVMVLNARVCLAEDALVKLAQKVREADDKGEELAWNLHVDLGNPESPFAAFWHGITKIWWRDYFRNPSPIVLNPENFDRYPKGTGAFLAKRERLLQEIDEFSSSFANQRLVSDDTRLLRAVAENPGIHLDPSIRCSYFGQTGARTWVKKSYYRGTTFVDGYLGRLPIVPAFVGALIGGIAFAILLVKRPRAALALLASGCITAGSIAAACGANRRESLAVGLLAPPFALCFGAGVVRGLKMAAQSAVTKEAS